MQTNGFLIRKRLYLLFALITFVLFGIVITYVKLAFRKPPAQPSPSPKVERGSIVDRNGKPLAVQTNFYHFGVTPKLIKDPKYFAETIAKDAGMRAEEILGIIASRKNAQYAIIKKHISQEQCDRLTAVIRDHNFSHFCRFDQLPGRIYPLHDLASQLVGYMGTMGTGLSGIEYSLEDLLSPEVKEGETEPTIYGKNIYLTIDSDLQYKLEKISKNAMESTQAENFMLIASDAKSGEILSYISLPSADLNTYPRSTPQQRIDRPAMVTYEPGSVFKIFTAAAYLDSGVIDEDTIFLCDGLYTRTTSHNETIRISCLDHHGYLSVRGALEFSCNDAFAQMSDLLNTSTFLSYIDKFGFGKKTGVELPREEIGYIKNPEAKSWSARTKATMSIGQELTVTALQMVQAAEVIANKGLPPKITLLKRIKDKDGNVEYNHSPEYGERVLKASTAKYLLSCMESTAEKGTGSRAALGDISIGVKTGTAQMADPVHGGYSDTDFISNCMAIFPVEEPQIVLYIVVEKAKGETYAGRIVAPVIREAADEIIDHLGMTRDAAPAVEHTGLVSITENMPLEIDDIVPDFMGRPKRDLIPLIQNNPALKFVVNGEGWVISQKPAPGSPVVEGMTIELNLE